MSRLDEGTARKLVERFGDPMGEDEEGSGELLLDKEDEEATESLSYESYVRWLKGAARALGSDPKHLDGPRARRAFLEGITPRHLTRGL